MLKASEIEKLTTSGRMRYASCYRDESTVSDLRQIAHERTKSAQEPEIVLGILD